MRIPKYIDEMLERKARVAEKYNELEYQIDTWLRKNNIEIELCDDSGGTEGIVNPRDSIARIRQCILEK